MTPARPLNYLSASSRFHDHLLSRLPEDVGQLFLRSLEQLIASPDGSTAKRVGDEAPGFVLFSRDCQDISLSGLLADGPVVLSFFRGGWCPFCSLEIQALNDQKEAIEARGAQLIGVSPEETERSRQADIGEAPRFQVLVDRDLEVTEAYGLTCHLPEGLKRLYTAYDFDVAYINNRDDWLLPIPATYVIARDGTIGAGYVNKDYTQRLEPANIVRELDKLAAREANSPT